jgi:hypothetical protein
LGYANTCSEIQYTDLIKAIFQVKNTLSESETIKREYLTNFALNEEALTAECYSLTIYWDQFGKAANDATTLKFLNVAEKYGSEGVDPTEELPPSLTQFLALLSKTSSANYLSDSAAAILSVLKDKSMQSWYITKVSKIASQSPYLQQMICIAGQMATCD